ncbi:MAG: bifunctional phosphoribosylaminoimidazolecarboxamide formyltransferase/IMP cyclohydrolase [Acidimicrobiia bacterium]|nr:bifunctional phosphoribosylaminoimidazolecarboxamide formyltransferase/IMP cyclohydrolase [Acidimicrobiia bacterium]
MKGQVQPIRRALLSVWDKSGLVEFARGLAACGISMISSGGTARVLRDADVPVTEVETVTGAPEILGGRVKTLHPHIHGGILAVRDDPEHMADLERLGIEPIDLVVTNLYPFSQAVADPLAGEDDIVEMIDIGGVTLVRAAAKNWSDVGIVTSPHEYGEVLQEIEEHGGLRSEVRKVFAGRAFALTAAYDAAINAWMSRDAELPETLAFAEQRRAVLRYGENPHQFGGLYLDPGEDTWASEANQHGGKEMSFNNIWDTEAAWRLVSEFEDAACVIVKHAMPCGVAEAASVEAAYRRAFDCDPTSAFGGVVALNGPVDEQTATDMADIFLEVVISTAFTPPALEVLATRKNLRVLECALPWIPTGYDMKRLAGGFVVQDWDFVSVDGWRVAGSVEPTIEQWTDLKFAWRVCAHVRSNTIVLARDRQAVGIGSGQQSRVDAAGIAARKAAGRAEGGVAASDAFFPFRDGLDACAESGVRAVVAPSGSVRDDEVAAAADDLGIALVWTPQRHFRH